MLSTDQKGAIAELAIITEALKLGVEVYRPCFEGGRYDLIFGIGPSLFRIQCKWAAIRKNVLTVRCYSSRRGPEGYINRAYSSDEVDALAAYCPDLDRCFLVPISEIDGRQRVHLRFVPARNNQTRRVNRADDFDFAATIRTLTGP
jgi:PD-(D/E)XK nuclease superfamily protein